MEELNASLQHSHTLSWNLHKIDEDTNEGVNI